jgi:hypothetical protein
MYSRLDIKNYIFLPKKFRNIIACLFMERYTTKQIHCTKNSDSMTRTVYSTFYKFWFELNINVADNSRVFYCVCPMWKRFNLSLTGMLIYFLINALLLLLLLITLVQGIKMTYLQHTMLLGYTGLQLYCGYSLWVHVMLFLMNNNNNKLIIITII